MTAASQDRRRRRARAGGSGTTGGGDVGPLAAEARGIVRRAAGDVAGKTIAAQIRQAARHLGYAPDDWRVREAWYGRAGGWSATALDELRRRFAASQAVAAGSVTLAQRVAAVRHLLTELERQVAGIEADVKGDR